MSVGMCSIILTVILALVSRSETSQFYYGRGGYYRVEPLQDKGLRLIGPNVCGSVGAQYCCSGWTQPSSSSNRCNRPICKADCGLDGLCMRPNLCLCKGNKKLGIPTKLAPSCEYPEVPTRHSKVSVQAKSEPRQDDAPRQCGCLNGGRCMADSSCQCSLGFTGRSCGQPLCVGGCQNGGRCIKPNQCACQFGFSGAHCATEVEGNQCLGALTGIKCTRALCCATLGLGWGTPCERCPEKPYPCLRGYIYVAKEDNCQDIDECSAISGLCVGGGICINTVGSYKCECQEGMIKNPTTNACEYISECSASPTACGENGACVDSPNGYYCRCYSGYQRSEDRKSCIDTEISECFSAVIAGECSRPMLVKHSLVSCCCQNQGAGWTVGIDSTCQKCPRENTVAYNTLCDKEDTTGVPRVSDVCRGYPNVCRNGVCIDTGSSSYRCQCDPGYIVNSQNECVDDDECMQLDVCKYGVCTNTDGSFRCACNEGYAHTNDGRSCTDMNECMESKMCPNGRCQNMDGAYKCLCNDGYRQSVNQQICYDINECVESHQSICANGICENIPGSYQCVCNHGYKLSPDNAFCLDYDECEQTRMCQNGRCLNMEGTYKCACSPGYTLSDDNRACVDVNECRESSTRMCTLGECINNQGSFRCVCAEGLVLDSDGRTCREVRKELCYKTVLWNGRCTDPSSEMVVKSECCCTLMSDDSSASTNQMCWGLSHMICPTRGTADYDILCRHNYGVNNNGEDINECKMFPNLCENGICQNLLKTGYRCICDRGFQNAPGLETKCVDIDECSYGDKCMGGVCRNFPGRYTCSCQAGLNAATSDCEDVDECENGLCVEGSCKNKLRGFDCSCPPHFIKQRNTTHIVCKDNRKYTCWSKHSEAGCEGSLLPRGITRDECCNTIGEAWGSPCQLCSNHVSQCQTGYYLRIGDQCTDINECELYPNLCVNGECVNTLGSYTCRCREGLILKDSHCTDLRRQPCYLSSTNGFCSVAMSQPTRRDQCCCSMGLAWGLGCETCPRKESAEHESLCDRANNPSVSDDFDECMTWPELCGPGKCKNLLDSYQCECPQGFTLNARGTNCTDIDECQLNPYTCGDGLCVNTLGTFECQCEEGYESHAMMRVCMDIDECANDVMLCHGGSCVNNQGSFSCLCPDGHEIMPGGKMCKDIDECSIGNSICSNGRCENFMGGYQCTCDKGFVPNDLHTACLDMDECNDALTKCEGGCSNTVGSYTCTCQNGYKLSPNGYDCVDINECLDDPNICGGGDCENEDGGYRCICTDGLELSQDQITCSDIDECSRNFGICDDGVCENSLGSYTCDCDPGFSKKPSDSGCTDDNECFGLNSCHEDADCTNQPGSYRCHCKIGYSGDGQLCRDVNECLSNNGGCDPDASCINTPGSYICMCSDGFTGNGEECFDIDECEDDPELCEHGECLNEQGSYSCRCDMGFTPMVFDKACEDINECEFEHLCVNGVCENLLGRFECICNEGYVLDETRSNCTDIDECERPESCKFGECVNKLGSFDCNCPQGYDLLASGNACVDRRLGSCYMNAPAVGQGSCSASYPGRVTRSKCCCSIGSGWGQNMGSCEACPKRGTENFEELCPEGGGLVPTNKDGDLIFSDLDECELLPALCNGGTCQNTYGSFQCTCPVGYVIDELFMCVDVNECDLYPDICGVGTCINMQGNYTCICPQGHLLMPDKNCMDMRKSTCLTRFVNSTSPTYTSTCENPLAMDMTKKLCCCSVGQGWLDPAKQVYGDTEAPVCDMCPIKGTDDYRKLCGLRPGYVFDKEINECLVIPNLCLNGRCVNTEGSYTCECNLGYQLDLNLLYCVDQDECSFSPCHETARCRNEPGSYRCMCPEGYIMDNAGSICSDINECEDLTVCNHGSCTNTEGGFVCQCDPGFTVSVNRRKCLDMNECDLQRDMCGNGTCTNMMGSYKCDCDEGFELGNRGRCDDIDECRVLRGICLYGRCKNNHGGFTCECQEGYRVTDDGRNCRDVNECTEETNMCAGGDCMNFDGYYKCLCPEGFKVSRGGTICVDIDECVEVKDVCLFGQCVNERGSYFCRCPPKFIQSFDGSKLKCMDTRVGLCFDSMANGECGGEMPVNISKSACCCAVGSPAAWSYGGVCETCPTNRSLVFEALCNMGIGYVEKSDGSIIDIDECLMHPDGCLNGQCINMDGGFRCQCDEGYQLHESSSYCIDQDECAALNPCGQGRCRNTIGGFVCTCNDGFAVGLNGKCEDINECEDFDLHNCAFRCHNMPGSYACICPAGYQLADDGKHCTDVDECLTPANNCRYACKNLIGTFICICPEGYEKTSSYRDECDDIDECRNRPDICQNGRCVNIDGGYRCECHNGYTPSATGSSCIDTREGLCYFDLDARGFCPTNTSGLRLTTRPFCCCSRAAAWGQSCTRCPTIGTSEHQRLCSFGPGFDVTGQDINECRFMSDACPNGRCLNTMGSYRCACNDGFKVGESGKECIDIDECILTQSLCEYKCVNTIGSFECGCDAGYSLAYNKKTCLDVNECTLGNYQCPTNATCINNRGGYTCQCPDGYLTRHRRCVDKDECSYGDVCGQADCFNTDGSYYCYCQQKGERFSAASKRCEKDGDDDDGFHRGKDEDKDKTPGAGDPDDSCVNEDCLFECEQFGSSYYCGCPLGYQLIDKGHCIATISPPDEEYFKNRRLPHVPGRQGNNLPLGEGCWLCGVNNVERAELVQAVTSSIQNRYRSKRDLYSSKMKVEKMLSTPVSVRVNASMTHIRDKTPIVTLIQSQKHSPNETYQLVGDENHKFRLNYEDNKVILTFNHKVVKRRDYKLVLVATQDQESQMDDLVLLPIEVHVYP